MIISVKNSNLFNRKSKKITINCSSLQLHKNDWSSTSTEENDLTSLSIDTVSSSWMKNLVRGLLLFLRNKRFIYQCFGERERQSSSSFRQMKWSPFVLKWRRQEIYSNWLDVNKEPFGYRGWEGDNSNKAIQMLFMKALHSPKIKLLGTILLSADFILKQTYPTFLHCSPTLHGPQSGSTMPPS